MKLCAKRRAGGLPVDVRHVRTVPSAPREWDWGRRERAAALFKLHATGAVEEME